MYDVVVTIVKMDEAVPGQPHPVTEIHRLEFQRLQDIYLWLDASDEHHLVAREQLVGREFKG